MRLSRGALTSTGLRLGRWCVSSCLQGRTLRQGSFHTRWRTSWARAANRSQPRNWCTRCFLAPMRWVARISCIQILRPSARSAQTYPQDTAWGKWLPQGSSSREDNSCSRRSLLAPFCHSMFPDSRGMFYPSPEDKRFLQGRRCTHPAQSSPVVCRPRIASTLCSRSWQRTCPWRRACIHLHHWQRTFL